MAWLKHPVVVALSFMAGSLLAAASLAQEATSRPATTDEPKADRPARPADDARPLRAKGPGEKPPRPLGEGGLQRLAKPPRDDDFDGPPLEGKGLGRRPPPDGERAGRRPPPDGEGPGRRPPPDGEGPGHRPPPDGEGPGHRPPLGAREEGGLLGTPRWPHEDWESMEKIDPEMYKLLKEDMNLERQTRELAIQYRQAPTSEREKIKNRTAEVVEKHFDVRQQRRSLELKRLESEFQRLREANDRRLKGRKELIEKRLTDLLGQEEDVRF